MKQESRWKQRLSCWYSREPGDGLSQLGFLVHHVLANDRVVLHELELVRRGALVLRAGVEVTGAGRRFQFDFFTGAFGHDVLRSIAWAGPTSDFFAAGAQVGQYRVNTVLVDGPQGGVRYTQADPAVLSFAPELTVLQVWQEATLGFIVGVGNVVTHHRSLTGHLAHTSHDLLQNSDSRKRMIIKRRPRLKQAIYP